MYAIAVRRTRRRSRRRNFKVFKARVHERLVVYEDPNDANRVVVEYEYALKRMHRARVSVPVAARMLREKCRPAEAQENPLAQGEGASKVALYFGAGALVALGLYVVGVGLGVIAKKEDTSAFYSYNPPLTVNI